MERPSRGEFRRHLALLGGFVVVLTWSAVKPFDYYTWFLEVLPAVLAVGILLATYRRFRLTTLAYVLIFFHAVILMVGGHYTYAKMPVFDWIRDHFDLARNYYDRLGHFAQGFVPAIVAREILLRTSPLKPGKWLFAIVTCICLAVSAFYELFEWWVALLSGESAEAFLGTQGDVWDTQWDMFICLCGAILSLLLLSKLHDRFLKPFLPK